MYVAQRNSEQLGFLPMVAAAAPMIAKMLPSVFSIFGGESEKDRLWKARKRAQEAGGVTLYNFMKANPKAYVDQAAYRRLLADMESRYGPRAAAAKAVAVKAAAVKKAVAVKAAAVKKAAPGVISAAGLSNYLPYILIGGGALLVILMLTKKSDTKK